MAQENLFSHRERTRKITNEHARTESLVDNSLGALVYAVKDAATHSLTCGIPDRESNDIRYLKQATELIEEWQNQLQGVHPVSRPSSDHDDVVLIERQR